MRYAVLILIIMAIVFGIIQISNYYDSKIGSEIKIGRAILNLEVAATETQRVQGLSGRESLPQTSGLLFVFPQEGLYGFWMKDMKFPIDIAWINNQKKIIHIESNVSPDTYPQVFSPKSSAMYVLETNAGFFQNHGIKIGDAAEF